MTVLALSLPLAVGSSVALAVLCQVVAVAVSQTYAIAIRDDRKTGRGLALRRSKQ
jgi:hypothetical protein